MDYNLTKFIGVGSRSGDYFISFNKSGFMISAGFCSQENVKNFSKIVLYYDESKEAVGFQLTNEDNAEGAFKLVHGNNGTTASVSARSFVKANNLIDSKYFGRRTPKKITYDGIGEVFIVDLIKPVDVVNEVEQNIAEQTDQVIG